MLVAPQMKTNPKRSSQFTNLIISLCHAADPFPQWCKNVSDTDYLMEYLLIIVISYLHTVIVGTIKSCVGLDLLSLKHNRYLQDKQREAFKTIAGVGAGKL